MSLTPRHDEAAAWFADDPETQRRLAFARAVKLLKEHGAETIRWCEEHGHKGVNDDVCLYAHWQDVHRKCQMVKRTLLAAGGTTDE
jgi:hypothetical protein